ncbi:MAG: alpha/beta hydrolase [Pirellulales bacterium]|nr:alpha/beta hydrolase [Pirellulales bacterium]
MMRPTYQFFRLLGLAICAIAVVLATSQATLAQRSSRTADIEDIKLQTKDGVRLGATYYPSSMGKEAVPVVMLHDHKESRAIFHNLARMLQEPNESGQNSHAVVTVDLRGHGESTKAASGRELESARLKTRDFRDMVTYDMEAVRKFLVTKNDEAALNLNKLCLLGSGLGANVAIYWTAVDWSAPKLPRIKQGQDVKGLFLSSPSWSSHGLPLNQPLRHPGVQSEVSVFLVYGEKISKAKKDAKTIHKNLARHHPKPKRGEKMPELVAWPLETELQATKLLVNPQFKILPHLNRFIGARLSAQDYEWLRRRVRN